ncbi:MAG: hypothetical protein KC561_07370 [Myxococcales bacterium]|nr:hypothetical protein [Myxococcales bacterium]
MRPRRRPAKRPRQASSKPYFINVMLLLVCLVVILVFKDIVADRASEFIEVVGGTGEGSADGTGTGPQSSVTQDIASRFVERAVGNGAEESGIAAIERMREVQVEDQEEDQVEGQAEDQGLGL